MILLDLDDTLIDHTKAGRTAALKFGLQYQDQIPGYQEDTFYERWHHAAERHYQSYLSGQISFQEQRRRRIREILSNPSISDRLADETFFDYLLHSKLVRKRQCLQVRYV